MPIYKPTCTFVEFHKSNLYPFLKDDLNTRFDIKDAKGFKLSIYYNFDRWKSDPRPGQTPGEEESHLSFKSDLHGLNLVIRRKTRTKGMPSAIILISDGLGPFYLKVRQPLLEEGQGLSAPGIETGWMEAEEQQQVEEQEVEEQLEEEEQQEPVQEEERLDPTMREAERVEEDDNLDDENEDGDLVLDEIDAPDVGEVDIDDEEFNQLEGPGVGGIYEPEEEEDEEELDFSNQYTAEALFGESEVPDVEFIPAHRFSQGVIENGESFLFTYDFN